MNMRVNARGKGLSGQEVEEWGSMTAWSAPCHCLDLPLDFILDYTNEQIQTLLCFSGFGFFF